MMTRSVFVLIVTAGFCAISGCSEDDNSKWIITHKPDISSGNTSLTSDTTFSNNGLSQSGECGQYIVSNVYPVKIEITMPEEVQVRAVFTHYIKITNLTDKAINGVNIAETMPKSFNYISSEPAVKKDDGNLAWVIISLGPRESRRITVLGTATSAGCVEQCSTVTCSFSGCAWTKVVEPKLMLSKKAPGDVMICEPIIVEYTLTNSGSGPASNLRIVDKLPAHLATKEGKDQVVFSLESLAPGQSKVFSTELRALSTGKFSSKAVLSSTGGFNAESLSTTTVVRQPVLSITKTGPDKLYFGKSATYRIKVTNKGDGAARDTVIEDSVPAGVTSPALSDGGIVAGNKASWQLGTLTPNASKTVSISYVPSNTGSLRNVATATAYCADSVSASASTSVLGIAAILLEVVDLEDPIEIGNEVTYEITATNQGSSTGTNIRIVCTLEDNQRYVSASGATTGTLIGKEVRFVPLSSLPAKEKATWKVVVKAVKAGDVRFKVEMNTDQIGRPVEETEATYLYERIPR